jgi:hypothetical protein
MRDFDWVFGWGIFAPTVRGFKILLGSGFPICLLLIWNHHN